MLLRSAAIVMIVLLLSSGATTWQERSSAGFLLAGARPAFTSIADDIVSELRDKIRK